MKFSFCPDCGSGLEPKIIGDEGYVPFCKKCDRPWFPLSYTCTITLVASDTVPEEFALIQQYNIPNDRFICVAGYLKPGESAETTSLREVEEEIGLKPLHTNYIGSYYLERREQLMLGFSAHVKKAEFTLSDEVDKAKWFSAEEAERVLPPNSIALNLFMDYLKTK